MQGDNLNSNDGESNSTSSVSDFVVDNDTTALREWLIERMKERELSFRSTRIEWTVYEEARKAAEEAASRANRQECLQLLLEYSDSFTNDNYSLYEWMESALLVACDANCEENVLLLLQKGYTPHLGMSFGRTTPLLIAVDKNYANIVTHLLRYGARTYDRNSEGSTALHLATSRNNREIGRILIENGACLETSDNDGNFVTHLASQHDDTTLMRLILDKNPDIIDLENHAGLTALNLAIKFGNMNCARYLFDKGAQMTCREFECIPREMGDTDKVEMVKLLLQHLNCDRVVELLDPNFYTRWNKSITCDIIDLHSVKCLSLLLQFGLPKCILQAPYFFHRFSYKSPLVHLLNCSDLSDEVTEAMIHLLLDHDIIFPDEYFQMLNRQGFSINCLTPPYFRFENFRADRLLCFYQILSDKGVTVDYALQCYCNFADVYLSVNHVNEFMPRYYLSTEYIHAMDDEDKLTPETLKFLISNSCILEPGLLAMRLLKLGCNSNRLRYPFMYNYLIEIQPMYYLRLRWVKEVLQDYLRTELGWPAEVQKVEDAWEEFSPVANEFAKSTLKQLCRTVIRESLRGKSVKDDLLYFQRKINELPLPTSLKNYLSYKDIRAYPCESFLYCRS